MKKDITKGDPEWVLMQEFFKFRKEYHDGEDDKWWDKAVDVAAGICEKYRGTELEDFAYSLLIGSLNDTQNRQDKKRNKRVFACPNCGKFGVYTS